MKLLFGLAAGAGAAIVAALVSLPLTSPDDAAFNSATVAIGALAAGLYLGALWMFASRLPNGSVMYAGAAVVSFGVVSLAAVLGESQLEGSIEFTIPLAAIVFAIATPLAPLLSALTLPRNAQLGGAAVSLVAALAIGIGLSGMGDSERGALELPGVSNDEPAPAANGSLTPDDVAGVVYTVVPDESQLTYTVREKLALLPASSDAVGRTGGLTGTVRLDGASEIQADMSTLTSDQERRDGYVRDRVFNTDPIVTFVLDSIAGLPEEYVTGTSFTSTVSGTATVRGVERPLTFEVEALLAGDELQVLGTTDFTWEDFQIPPPDIAGIVDVENDVHIEVLIIAQASAGA